MTGPTDTPEAPDDAPRSSSGAPLTAKGVATRGRIVQAASALVFENGVEQTSVDDVRNRAGVSASQLYHYFTDKQALIRAVIAHQTAAVLAAQRPVLDHLTSLEAFRQWRDLLVDMQRARHCLGGCPIGSLVGQLADNDHRSRTDLATGFARWEEPIRLGLHTMRDRGDLMPHADPDRLAVAVLAALQGGLLLTQTRRSTAPLEAALDAILAHVSSFAPPDPRLIPA